MKHGILKELSLAVLMLSVTGSIASAQAPSPEKIQRGAVEQREPSQRTESSAAQSVDPGRHARAADPSSMCRAGGPDSIGGFVTGAGAPIPGSTVTLWAAGTGAPKQLAQTQTGADGCFVLLSTRH